MKVAGVACYITSFQELLPSATGVQEAEQSIPHFIEQGLDFADWVELFAPKPYAIISTMSDMFPFEGARQTYDEVKRIYKLYGAEDRLQWITGPGGHGNLGPISPAILGFFIHHLAGGPAGDASLHGPASATSRGTALHAHRPGFDFTRRRDRGFALSDSDAIGEVARARQFARRHPRLDRCDLETGPVPGQDYFVRAARGLSPGNHRASKRGRGSHGPDCDPAC